MGDLSAPLLELKQRLPDLKQVAASAVAEPQPTISIAAQAEEEPKRPRRRVVTKNAKRPAARKAKRRV